MARVEMQAPGGVAASLSGLVDAVSGSTSVEELEQAYLGEVRRFIDCPAAGFYVLDPLRQGAEHFEATGVSDYFLSRYEEVGRRRDPVLRKVLEDQAAVHSGALMDLDQWRSLEVYQEVFRLHRMVHLLEAPVVYDGRVIGTLNFGGDEDSEPFTSEQTMLATALGKLVGMVLGSLWRQEDLREERESLLCALELCEEAMILTDLKTGRRQPNAAARRILEKLSVSPGGPDIDRLVAPPEPSGEGARIEQARVTLSEGREAALRVHSMPLPDSPSVVVSFLALHGCQTSVPPVVERSLTSREREVALLVARGFQDGEIAEELYLSPFTVKQYLKDTYRKLGLRSRVDLALLISGSHAPPLQGSS